MHTPSLKAAAPTVIELLPMRRTPLPSSTRPVRLGEEAHRHAGRNPAHPVFAVGHHPDVADEGEARRFEVGTEGHVVDVSGGILVGEAHRVGAPMPIDRAILQSFVA
jgi:hypothetical protein